MVDLSSDQLIPPRARASFSDAKPIATVKIVISFLLDNYEKWEKKIMLLATDNINTKYENSYSFWDWSVTQQKYI